MNMNVQSISKFMSLVLRHKPELISLDMDKNGWVSVKQLIKNSRSVGKYFDETALFLAVKNNNKQRFVLSDDSTRIRANQGHSIKVNLDLEQKTPPEKLFHGTLQHTYDKFISKGGLNKMKRHAVHLSHDIDTAINVGSRRKGKVVILEVDAQLMHLLDNKFFLSKNGVWLTDNVDPKFIKVYEHGKS